MVVKNNPNPEQYRSGGRVKTSNTKTMTETAQRAIPISKKWDTALTYEEIKENAKYAFYSKGDQYPVNIVMGEEKGHDGTARIWGFAVGTWRDGIIIAHEFRAPKHAVDTDSITKDINDLVRKFLDESEWW